MNTTCVVVKKRRTILRLRERGPPTGFLYGIVLTEVEPCRGTESERESNGRWNGNLVNYTAKSPCHLLLSLSAPFLQSPVASNRREQNRGPGHGGPSMSFYDPCRMYGPELVHASPMTSQRSSPIWGPLFEDMKAQLSFCSPKFYSPLASDLAHAWLTSSSLCMMTHARSPVFSTTMSEDFSNSQTHWT